LLVYAPGVSRYFPPRASLRPRHHRPRRDRRLARARGEAGRDRNGARLVARPGGARERRAAAGDRRCTPPRDGRRSRRRAAGARRAARRQPGAARHTATARPRRRGDDRCRLGEAGDRGAGPGGGPRIALRRRPPPRRHPRPRLRRRPARPVPGRRRLRHAAARDATLWTEIFLMNRDQLLPALRALEEPLGQLERALEAGDAAALTTWLTRAADWRRRLDA